MVSVGATLGLGDMLGLLGTCGFGETLGLGCFIWGFGEIDGLGWTTGFRLSELFEAGKGVETLFSSLSLRECDRYRIGRDTLRVS